MRQLLLFCTLATLPWQGAAGAQSPQTTLILENYFPAEFEFPELQEILSEERIRDLLTLGRETEGSLYAEAGWRELQRRQYRLISQGFMSIETVEFEDNKAALSMYTLLGQGSQEPGPPGVFFSSDGDQLSFSRSHVLVRITSPGAGELMMRVARSVHNRIGHEADPPTLISRLPDVGIDRASVRYFLGPRSISQFSSRVGGQDIVFRPDLELVQASYSLAGQRGTLSLIGAPTPQLAEAYLDEMLAVGAYKAPDGQRLYFKRAGTFIGVLQGAFEPATAQQLLSALQFHYTIQWIFDTNNRYKIPLLEDTASILGTVVRSLLFAVLLGALSWGVGLALGLFRLALRSYAPDNFLDRRERTELIRLKIHEKN